MAEMPPDSRHVYSSNVEMIGYDPAQEILYVQYKTGKIYVYTNVDNKRGQETMDAPSIGEALQYIKKNPQLFPYKAIN